MTKSRVQYLSHYIDQNTPGYGGSEKFTSRQERSICCGDSSNKIVFEMSNHFGTHIDFPNHFINGGKKINDYEPLDLIFKQVNFCEIILKNGELLSSEHFKNYPITQNVDFIIIRTQFELYRHEDIYWKENPGLHPNLAGFLKSNFKNLKGIGFDFISASSFLHRTEGREAHKNFLGTNNGQPILLVEDMKLGELTKAPSQLIIAPLLIRNADGIQVTAIAFD